jgi:hypothetical protein
MIHARRMIHTPRAVALVMAGSMLTLTVGVVAASPASAKGRVVRSSGTCSNGAHWKLKAKADDRRLEVEFEVDTNRNGQKWTVKLRDNGATVYSGTRTTSAPSGSFSVNRLIANRAGADVITAKATRAGTGATCSGSATF